MIRQRFTKKLFKGLMSGLLVLSLLTGLFVPFSAQGAGDEAAATGSRIYAFLNYIDMSKTPNKQDYNLELVFKSENVKDSNYYKGPYTDFADIEYVTTTYTFDSTGRPAKTWNYNQWSPANTPVADRLPWRVDSYNGDYIRKVTFKDKIAPKSIAGWFSNLKYLCKFENFENLDVSQCENMAYAFWGMSTGYRGDNIMDGTDNLRNQYLKNLDLSEWDTSKCRNFDCFINSGYLENLDISNLSFAGLNDNIVDVGKYGNPVFDANGKRTSGYPDYTGAMRTINCLVYNCSRLQTIKLDGMDFADIEFLHSFISNCGVSKIDLSKVKNDPIHITSGESWFNGNPNLKEIIFGTEENPFEIGTEPMYLGYPRNGGIDPFRPDDKNGSGNYYENGYKSNAVWLGNMFANCPSLETIDLQYLRINGFGKKADGTSYAANSPDYGKTGFERTNPNLGSGFRYQLNSFFYNCTALERIDNLKNLGFMPSYSGAWGTRMMFQNCQSLSEIDLSTYWANLGGPNQFQNCRSLKKLDLSNMGRAMVVTNYWYTSAYDIMSKGFQSYNDSVNPKVKQNVFEGCTELSEVVLSPYYYGEVPHANRKDSDSARPAVSADKVLTYTPNNTFTTVEKDIPPVDPEALWVKIKDPEEGAFQLSELKGNYYMSTDRDRNTALESTTLYPVNGDPLTTLELFGDYKPHYAGTWVRASKVALVAKGATPAMQTFDGAVGLPVNYDPESIQEPVRPGYEFLGWYATDENGVEKKLEDQLAANKDDNPDNDEFITAWTYYAKWREHKYNLVLNGNLGTTNIHNEQTGVDETVDSFTAKENLPYSEYFELNNTMFTRSGYVLSGWNTRPNGSGDQYAANESVARLTTVDGATVTLYAQWHRPDLILHFNANYEGAPSMPDKNYTLVTGETTYYGDLAEATRNGYTFGGWYTAAEGGTKVEANMEVNTQYDTLYAHWFENPVITFNANGGYFEIKSGTSASVIRQYKYNQNFGVIPTPVNDSAVLKGWYTKDGTGGDWGDEITSAADNGGTAIASASDKIATQTKTYYARWGYQPEFETNGGVYKTFGNYPVQDSDQYVVASDAYAQAHPDSTIPTLPTFKDETGFEGWYFGDTNITEYLKTHDTYTIDLSQGKAVEAKWATKSVYEVTLHPDGGSLPTTYLGTKDGNDYYRVKVYAGNDVKELPVPAKSVGSTVYEFLGWYTKDGTGGDWGDKKDYTFEPAGNCDLYARWAAKDIAVNFDAGDGTLFLSSDATIMVRNGGCVNRLPGANRSGGFIFGGWYSDLSDEGTKLTTATPITSNTTYHAKWISAESNYTQSDDALYKYTVKWDNSSNEYATNLGDNLVIDPTNGNAALSATVYIRFAFDKVVAAKDNRELPVGAVNIKIPKYVFATKDGTKVGSNNISNGLSKTDTANCHFIYSDSDPDYYIITNNEKIDKDAEFNDQVFQIDYRLEPADLRKMDGGYKDENGYYGGNYYTNTFPVTIRVDRAVDGDYTDTLDTDYQKQLSLEVHTKVNASTSKSRSTVYFEWQDAWGTAPQDANQYFYVVWDLIASFDNTNSQRFKFSWSEDTVHDGSVVMMTYGSGYTSTGYMGPGTYHTSVVTKHARKTTDEGWKTVYNEAVLNIESISGYQQQMRVSREDGVYLIPTAPGRVFEKYIYGYEDGADRIKSGGTELILNRTGVEDLKYEIKYQEYQNSDAQKVWHSASKTYSVAERNIEITDGAKGSGDVVLSNVSGSDRYNWDCASNLSLSDADYSFTNLDIYLTEYDAIQVHDDWSEPYEHSAIRDYGDVEIWVRGENENSFRLFKTLTAADFSAPDAENGEKADYGAALAAGITLPENTAGYKIVHKSSFYTTKLMVCPTLFLRSTNKVYSFVQENMLKNVNTLIKNNAALSVDGEEAIDTKRMDQGGALICSYELKTDESYLYVTKKCAEDKKDSDGNDYYYVDSQSGTQEFPVLISAWGLNRAGSTKLMKSGVFYDLLPYNFTVDKSTVFVQGRKEKNSTNSMHAHSYKAQSQNNNNFPSSLYSVEFIENWEGSGRTMMKITITGIPDNLPASYANAINGFNVFYKMKTTMSNVIANGTTQMNYVSFTDTTENQTVPVSRDRALSSMAQMVIPYYKSINDAYKEFTAYASDATHCKLPSQYVTGFNSSVKTEGVFMMEDKTVGLSSDYSYNVTFTDGESEAGNVVIYDVIENSYNGSNCEWRGTFESVNVSAIQNMQDVNSTDSNPIYCEPKVYYLVKDGTVIPEDLDLINHPDLWSDTVPADKTTIKAIAIDCRTASNGGDFTLPARRALSFNVSMHSPDTSEENDLITYNEAIVKALVSGQPNSSRAITRLTLHYADPVIGKTSFPESGKDAEHRTGAANGSTIDYSIVITNPDKYVPIRNIVIEDLLDAKLKINSIPKVSKGDDEPVSINSAAGITYHIDPQESGRDKFSATITQLDPGEKMTIILPATVTGAAKGDTIDNTAYITSANGSTLNVQSDTTYHYVTNTQAKIKKVNANGDGLAGASLQILSSDKSQVLFDNITSTADVMSFDLVPGDYVLHEVSTPNNEYYKLAADIPFSIDIEGINKVGNKPVSYVEMVDEPAYEVVFHVNQPGQDDEIFKVFGPADLDAGKIKHFYDIPSFAGDEYVFAGWYHAADYSAVSSEDRATIAANFEADTYAKTDAHNPADYHLYAKWIEVGKVAAQDQEDTYNYGNAGIRGFGLVGAEIRDPGLYDPNYNSSAAETTPGGLRFITSLSEDLLSDIGGLSNKKVEYGYVVATEANIKRFIKNYNVSDITKYKLAYNGRNVNGVDTTGLDDKNQRFETDEFDNKVLARKDLNADNDFVYVTNVNCTKGTGSIKNDHRNFSDYRLYTLIVTFEGEDADKKDQKIDARAYIRYTDANGKERIFYNNYKKNLYYGGCLSSFNQAKSLARPTNSEWIGG